MPPGLPRETRSERGGWGCIQGAAVEGDRGAAVLVGVTVPDALLRWGQSPANGLLHDVPTPPTAIAVPNHSQQGDGGDPITLGQPDADWASP